MMTATCARVGTASAVFALLCVLATQALAQSVSLSSDFGPVQLQFGAGGAVTGQYPTYRGVLEGTLGSDGRLAMTWAQPNSERRCTTSRGGTPYWGRVEWQVAGQGQGQTVKGRWSYCEDAIGAGGAWNGVVLQGRMPTATAAAPPPAPRPAPASPQSAAGAGAVSDAAVSAAVRERWGAMSILNDPKKQLSGDFNCDGITDRLFFDVDTLSKSGPDFFLMAVVSNKQGGAWSSDLRLGYKDKQDGGALCIPSSAGLPQVAFGTKIKKAEADKLLGYTSSCGQIVTIADQACDSWGVFWLEDPLKGGNGPMTHLVVVQSIGEALNDLGAAPAAAPAVGASASADKSAPGAGGAIQAKDWSFKDWRVSYGPAPDEDPPMPSCTAATGGDGGNRFEVYADPMTGTPRAVFFEQTYRGTPPALKDGDRLSFTVMKGGAPIARFSATAVVSMGADGIPVARAPIDQSRDLGLIDGMLKGEALLVTGGKGSPVLLMEGSLAGFTAVYKKMQEFCKDMDVEWK